MFCNINLTYFKIFTCIFEKKVVSLHTLKNYQHPLLIKNGYETSTIRR